MDTGENLMGTPSSVIRFNKLTGQLEKPTILLKTRGGNTIGELQYTNLNLSFVGKGLDNLSFDVHKVVDGKECKYWDKLIDLCVIDYVGYGQFECNVTINDEDETIKSCVCESLETELGQHTIRDMHINDEDAIMYGRKVGNTNVDFDTGETSGKFIPTVLYNKNDQQHSLLDRVLSEKTPHWSVGYVSPQFAVNGYVYDADQIERTFTISGTTPYDFFDSDVSKEFGCVFTYDTYNRKVNCYNLDACVYDKKTNEIKEGYYYIDGFYYDENDNQIIDDSNLGYCSGIGQDTTIFMSKSKLANSFSIDSDAGSVKNCFYVSGGDDEITNIVAAANVTGDNYIYMFGNFQYEDMSPELVDKIKSYATLLSEKEEEFNKVGGVYVYDSDGKYEYNTEKQRIEDKNGRIIVNSKYVNGRIYVLDTLAYYENGVAYNKDCKVLSSSDYIYDKPGLYTEYTSLVDRINYWEHTRFPDVTPSNTTAEDEKNKIIDYFGAKKVYIKNGCTSTSFAHVTSAIESLIGIACDSRYTVTIYKDTEHTLTCTDIDDKNKIGVWNGVVNIKRTTDETDYAEFNLSVNVELTYDIDNSIGLCKQNMEIAIARMDIVELDFTKLSKDELEKLLRQYNLNSLKSFRDGFDSCRATLNDLLANMELEEAEVVRFEDDAMLLSLDRYNERYDVANSLYIELEEYIDELSSQKEVLEDKIDSFRADLDMRTIFGEELWKEFRSYVREDEYNNPNYISDGLTNCEALEKAKELLDVAKKELSKACVIQKTISGDINNIFSLEEKELLHDKFALFNYVRVRADDNIYKLRLMEISFSEDSPEKLNVTFSEQIEDVSGKKSDVQKILEQSQSIATTYSSTTKQAKQGASAMSNFNTLKQEGLDSSLYLIKNSNTEEVTFGNTGLSCKSMLDQGIYSPYEVRVTHNGIYMSEDNFNSVNTALGRFKYNDEWVYGVNTSVLFGDLIMGEKMIISNKNGSVNITGDGITLDGGAITWTKKLPSSSVEGLDEKYNDFIGAIGDLQSQIDGEITSWFEEYEPTTTNEPASTWITDSDKIKHEGDLFYNTATGAAYRYIYNSSTKQHEWSVITDTAITEALEKASKAQDTADKKRRVFVVTPTPPYDIGDLWSQGSDGDLMKCKVAKTEGQTYSASDWEKASKYTDDSALVTFVNGDYKKALENINTQIDGKADTFYQSAMPHPEYTNVVNNKTYNLYVGDLWYNTTDGKSYMYQKIANGSNFNYTWEYMDVPKDVYDKIDGVASIYVTIPSNPNVGDLLIPNSDISGTNYKAGKVYKYNGSTWNEIKYTDDSSLNNFIKNVYSKEIAEISNQSDRMFKTYYQEEMPYDEVALVLGDGTQSLYEERNARVYDIWCCNDPTSENYKKIYKYVKTSYPNKKEYYFTWEEDTTIPPTIFDMTDGLNSVYLSLPTTYNKNDLYILEQDRGAYSAGTLMVALNSKINQTTYVESDWAEKVKYTDDTTAQEALKQAKQGIKDAADNLNIAKKHTDDAIKDFDEAVAEYLQVPGATTIVGGNHVISPYIAGGYLYITKDGCEVEIDPSQTYNSTNDKVISVKANNSDAFYIKRNGDAYFKGEITATSGVFTGSIQSSNIYSYLGSYKDLPIDEQGRHYYSQTYEYEEVSYSTSTTGIGTIYLYYDESCNGAYAWLTVKNYYDLTGTLYSCVVSTTKDTITSIDNFYSYEYYEVNYKGDKKFFYNGKLKYYISEEIDDGSDIESGMDYIVYKCYDDSLSVYYLYVYYDSPLTPEGGAEYIYNSTNIFNNAFGSLSMIINTIPCFELNNNYFKIGNDKFVYSFANNSLNINSDSFTINTKNLSISSDGTITAKKAVMDDLLINNSIYYSNPQQYINPSYGTSNVFLNIYSDNSNHSNFAMYAPWKDSINSTNGVKIIYGNDEEGFIFYGRSTSTGSDIRLKDNIKNTEINALNIINDINLYSFDWKKDGKHQDIGFIADELEKIDKNFVSGGGYYDDGSMNVKTVNDFYMQGYIVKSIQELSSMVELQQERIKELESEIQHLKQNN